MVRRTANDLRALIVENGLTRRGPQPTVHVFGREGGWHWGSKCRMAASGLASKLLRLVHRSKRNRCTSEWQRRASSRRIQWKGRLNITPSEGRRQGRVAKVAATRHCEDGSNGVCATGKRFRV